MQDNNPKYIAKKIVKWFKTNKIKLLSYPAQLPDLNLIEHIWHYLKLKLNTYENPLTGIIDLWEYCETE